MVIISRRKLTIPALVALIPLRGPARGDRGLIAGRVVRRCGAWAGLRRGRRVGLVLGRGVVAALGLLRRGVGLRAGLAAISLVAVAVGRLRFRLLVRPEAQAPEIVAQLAELFEERHGGQAAAVLRCCGAAVGCCVRGIRKSGRDLARRRKRIRGSRHESIDVWEKKSCRF